MARFWPLLLIAGGIAGFYWFGLDELLGLDGLRRNRNLLLALVDRWGVVAPVLFGCLYSLMVVMSLPGAAIMTLFGGFLFGAVVATGVISLAATLGATGLYLAARTALGDSFRARAGPWMRRLEAGFAANAFTYLLVLRLVPLFPFWLVNLAPAFLHVPLRTYVVATFIGIIPATFVFAWIGSGLGEVLDRGGEPDLGLIFSPNILGPLVALAALALIPPTYRWARDRSAQRQSRG